MQQPAIKKPLLLACLFLSAGLSGCAVFWPQAGKGGFAEHRFGLGASRADNRFDDRFNTQVSQPRSSNLVQANGYSNRGWVAETPYVHDVAMPAFDKRIADLKARGAERCAPGDLAKSEQLLVRVKREWAGELYDEALSDIKRLERRLDVVDQRASRGQCQPGGQVIAHRSIHDGIITKSVATNSSSTPLSLNPADQAIPSKLQTIRGTR